MLWIQSYALDSFCHLNCMQKVFDRSERARYFPRRTEEEQNGCRLSHTPSAPSYTKKRTIVRWFIWMHVTKTFIPKIRPRMRNGRQRCWQRGEHRTSAKRSGRMRATKTEKKESEREWAREWARERESTLARWANSRNDIDQKWNGITSSKFVASLFRFHFVIHI